MLKKQDISQIEIVPVQPSNGLVAFCSFVILNSLYCNSIAIYTRPQGGFRLLYPTKLISGKQVSIVYPINKQAGKLIEQEVIKKYKDVINHGGYSSDRNR